MSLSPVTALERLARTAGGAPLLTHYGPAGERTELSVATFANWVAKTANLLEELAIDEDAVATLPVLVQRPAHWMALVWPFALWQRGLAATLPGPDASASDLADADADLVVLGPVDPRPLGEVTVACSLDAWGRPLADLPDGVVDHAGEALAQPDAALSTPAGPGAPAWTDPVRSLSVADVAALEPSAERVVLTPRDAWEATSWLVRAVLGGGSVVLVESGADLGALAASERARVVA